VKIQYFEVEIFHIAILIQIHFAAFATFAQLQICKSANLQLCKFSLIFGSMSLFLLMQTCKLANLQTLQTLQMLQTLQRVQQKGGRSGGAIFLLLFGFYPLDDSAN